MKRSGTRAASPRQRRPPALTLLLGGRQAPPGFLRSPGEEQWTSTAMAQRQPTVLPGTSQTQSNAEWSLDAHIINRNCVREYKDILHRYSYKYSLQECDI